MNSIQIENQEFIDIPIIPKVWGSEHIIINIPNKYCSKIMELRKDYQCSIHCHKTKHETFYILDGLCVIEWGEDPNNLKGKIFGKGYKLTIEPNIYHRFSGIGYYTEILEISTFDDPNDSFRIDESKYVENGSEIWRKNFKEIY